MEEGSCASGLKPGLIDQKTFERELGMCGKLHRQNGGRCCWGECAKCGVIPLLYKLGEGKLLETDEEVAAAKEGAFKESD